MRRAPSLPSPGLCCLQGARPPDRLRGMAEAIPEQTIRKSPSTRRQIITLLISNLVYLLLVYVPGWFIYPLGPDFARMAAASRAWSLDDFMLRMALAAFGTRLWAYHAVNLLLLYACMVCIFFLTRLLLKGPWWYGSLAAVLFMTHPVKNETVLLLSGADHLLALLLALLAFCACFGAPQCTRRSASWLLWTLSILLLALAIAKWHALAATGLIPALYALLHRKALLPALPFALLSVGWAIALWTTRQNDVLSFRPDQLAPLLLLIYPLGFLPRTLPLLQFPPAARHFPANATAWESLSHVLQILWAWTMPLAVMLLMLLAAYAIHRATRRPAFLFCVLSAAMATPPWLLRKVDLCSFENGALMAMPLVFAAIALAAIAQGLQQHPKWQRPVVTLTTALCLFMMALECRSVLAWRHAGQTVVSFQGRTALTAAEHPGETLALVADFAHLRDAPLQLLESVRYDTPFSKAYPAQRFLLFKRHSPCELRLSLLRWDRDLVSVGLESETFLPELNLTGPQLRRDMTYALLKRGEARYEYHAGDEDRVKAAMAGARMISMGNSWTLDAPEDFPRVLIPYRVLPESPPNPGQG